MSAQFSPEVRALAVELRAQGHTFQQIADTIGASWNTVYFWFNDKARQRHRDRNNQWVPGISRRSARYKRVDADAWAVEAWAHMSDRDRRAVSVWAMTVE